MKFLPTLFTILVTNFCFAQNSIALVLEKLNKKTVPYITVSELQSKKDVVILDARENNEFIISHIKNAIPVGFNKFNDKKITTTIEDRNTNIVVYCSIGVRSEKIGERILKLGYKNVFNLYGGIFEWKNQGGKVVNNQNLETEEIHTFNKEWSAYASKGKKVYEN